MALGNRRLGAASSVPSVPTVLREVHNPGGEAFKMPPSPAFYPNLEVPPWSEEQEYEWRALLKINPRTGKFQMFQCNAEYMLRNAPIYAGAIAFDWFSGEAIMLRPIPGGGQPGDPIQEEHLFAARAWGEENLDVSFSISVLTAALRSVALANPRHKIRDWLMSQSWDGQPRLDMAHSTYFGAVDTDYNHAVVLRFMVGGVARAMEPGCKLDTCLVLEGPQGSFKSTSIQVLFMSPALVNDTSLDLRSKDAFIGLQGMWAVEFSELESLSKVDASRVKAFFSSSSDKFRVPFGINLRKFPRSCVFVGTCNESSYLQDTTGGRRFWPLRVGRIDLNALARDREQLWAEAVALYNAGEQWHLTYEEELLAREVQDGRRQEHPYEEPIAQFLARRKDVTLGEVLAEAIGKKTWNTNSAEGRTVSQILTGVFGWRRGKVARPDGRVNGYAPPSTSNSDVVMDDD